jgi:hypothetical protein
MTRGDQRDRDRLARQKREAEESKGRADGKSLTQAREDDAAKMRAKQAAAEAKKAAGGG